MWIIVFEYLKFLYINIINTWYMHIYIFNYIILPAQVILKDKSTRQKSNFFLIYFLNATILHQSRLFFLNWNSQSDFENECSRFRRSRWQYLAHDVRGWHTGMTRFLNMCLGSEYLWAIMNRMDRSDTLIQAINVSLIKRETLWQ